MNNSNRCWIEINMQQMKDNLLIYQSSCCPNCSIMAVIKANAYGHGDSAVAKFLSQNGIKYFAVSNIDEAIHLRNEGLEGEILILGYTPIERISELIYYNITQTLISEEYAEKIAQIGIPIKCQFAIDTGMRRIGLNADHQDSCEQTIRKYNSILNLEGLFTHLCVADTPDQNWFTKKQIQMFENICVRVSDLNLKYCHCMNSAGGLWHISKFSCFIRLGIILYGLKPDYMNILPEGIKPVLTWKSVICMVKEVKFGDTIGYGRSYTVEHSMKIATIPTGYADGYPRILSNKGWVLINKKKAPIVGRICMDQMIVDVTNIPNVKLGTEVVLIGSSGDEVITADDLAHISETIGYEIICGISKRVEKFYIN